MRFCFAQRRLENRSSFSTVLVPLLGVANAEVISSEHASHSGHVIAPFFKLQLREDGIFKFSLKATARSAVASAGKSSGGRDKLYGWKRRVLELKK